MPKQPTEVQLMSEITKSEINDWMLSTVSVSRRDILVTLVDYKSLIERCPTNELIVHGKRLETVNLFY